MLFVKSSNYRLLQCIYHSARAAAVQTAHQTFVNSEAYCFLIDVSHRISHYSHYSVQGSRALPRCPVLRKAAATQLCAFETLKPMYTEECSCRWRARAPKDGGTPPKGRCRP